MRCCSSCESERESRVALTERVFLDQVEDFLLLSNFVMFSQGFPGDIGPPGQNGIEGPKVCISLFWSLKVPKICNWVPYCKLVADMLIFRYLPGECRR